MGSIGGKDGNKKVNKNFRSVFEEITGVVKMDTFEIIFFKYQWEVYNKEF